MYVPKTSEAGSSGSTMIVHFSDFYNFKKIVIFLKVWVLQFAKLV